jgi:hypothetical protein
LRIRQCSRMTLVPMALLFGWLTTRITYGGGLLDAVLMGTIESSIRALSVIFGGILVLTYADGAKKPCWAFTVPILYIAYPSGRYHFYLPPTAWDRLEQRTEMVFPSICIVLIGYLRRTHSESTLKSSSRFWILCVASFAVAFTGASVSHLDEGNSVSTMLRLMVPLWLAWGAIVFATFWRFKSRAFWLLIGAPLTFLWVYDLALRLLSA